MMSWYAPPLTLISRTPPSNPLSRLKAFLKLACAGRPLMWITGLTSSVTPKFGTSGAKASFGALDGFVVDVTHGTSVTVADVLHQSGKAGAITPSKFSANSTPG